MDFTCGRMEALPTDTGKSIVRVIFTGDIRSSILDLLRI